MKHLLQYFTELSLHPKNAEELKGLILQLAIQGKLTAKWREENPEVEPAAVLLEQIKEEKARLVKEKKIKKEKQLPEIAEDEIPFKLPKNWSWSKLNDISYINGGFAFKSTEYVENGVRVVRISDFDENGFKNNKIVRFQYSDDLKPYQLEINDIIMAMTGGTVGKSYFVKSLDEQMVVNQRVATIKLIKPVFEAYVNCVIPTKLIQDVINEAKNSTNDNISMSNIKNFLIPLPPLEEQKAIVKTVNQLFLEVEQLETLTKERIQLKEDFVTSALQQLHTGDTATEWAFLQQHFSTFFTGKRNIKKLRESILQLAVQGKLTHHWRKENPEVEPASGLLERIQEEKAQLVKAKKIKKEKPLPAITEEEMPYDLPEGWVWCRLGDVIKEKPRNGFSPRGVNFITETKSLKLGATTKGFFDATQVKYLDVEIPKDSHLWLQTNDILIQRSNSLDYVGVSAVYDGIELDFVYPDLMMKIQASTGINPNYLHIVLSSRSVREYFRDNASGTSGNMPKINQGIVLNTLIPLIGESEQKAIVEKVNTLMSLCDQLAQAIQTSKATQEDWMQSSLREVFEREATY